MHTTPVPTSGLIPFFCSKGNLGELKQTINASPFLLRREQLLFNRLWAVFLDTGVGFCFHSSIMEFRAVQNDGERGQCRFPGDWKRSEAVSAFFKGMVCPWGPLLLGVRRLSALGFWIGPCGSSELSAPQQTCLALATRRRQLQHAADGEYPFTDPANAGMRRKFDLPLDRPLSP